MKNYIALLMIISLGLLFGCTKADEEDQKNVGTLTLPIAGFYFTGNDGPAPVTVTFHNTSEYSDKWEWTFKPSNSTSNEFEPSFTYHNNTGEDQTFLVILTAADSGTGETNTRSKSVLVHPSN